MAIKLESVLDRVQKIVHTLCRPGRSGGRGESGQGEVNLVKPSRVGRFHPVDATPLFLGHVGLGQAN